MQWREVLSFDECPEGASEHVVAGRMVALFRQGDELFALDGVCPHQGGPLGQGTLETDSSGTCYVTCPWHGWQFDVSNGCHRTSPLKQPSLPAKIEGGMVFVSFEEESSG